MQVDGPGKEPPHEADALGALVVAGHSDVDELGGRVDIGECNNGDVGVGSLGDGLMVAPGVGDEEEPWLPEGSLDLIGEGARGEAASDGGAADVPVANTEFKHLNWCFPFNYFNSKISE